MDLLELAERALREARAAGADGAEVFVGRTRALGVTASGPTISSTTGEESGVAIRVHVAGRSGFSGAASHRGIDILARRAIEAAKRAGAGSSPDLLGPAPPQHAGRFQGQLEAADAERSLAIVTEFIEAARKRPEVNFAQALVRRHIREFAIVNSAGRSVVDRTGGGFLDVEVRVHGSGVERTTRVTMPDEPGAFERFRAQAILDELVPRAQSALKPEPLTATVDSVILQPSAASQLVGLALAGLSGLALETGKSPLASKVGTEVFSPQITIDDDPAGRRVYDDEGTPTRPTSLIEAGRVRSFLHIARTARAMGTQPGGHAYRPGLSAGPKPRAHRPGVAVGEHSLEELMEEAGRAILVTEPLLGAFVSDKVTSDFSVVAPFAFYVEGGRIRHALPPTTLGGNAHEVLRHVRAVGNVQEPRLTAATPSLLTGGITCAT